MRRARKPRRTVSPRAQDLRFVAGVGARSRLSVLLMVAVLLVACGGGDDSDTGARSPSAGRTATVAAPSPHTAKRAADMPCAERPGREIAAVEIPAVTIPAVHEPDRRLAGHVVKGFDIARVEIPAQRVPAMCATRDPAPAGCFGAVRIPGVTIPGVSLPAVGIPEARVRGAAAPAVTQPAVTQPAVTVGAVRTAAVCAQKVRPGELRPSVFQPSTFRPSAFRPSLFRPSVFRASVCVGGDCIASVSIPSVSVPSVSVPSVSVPSRSLASRTLPEIRSRCVSVLGGREETAYHVCADVLFAFDRAAIRSAASSALRSVARSIDERYAGRRITVEGHTDARGEPAYNRRLSLRRAESVKAWLVRHGGLGADRIVVKGFGEARPVSSNASAEGRARNRRVVIGILAG